ncbi:amino acid adenylation domain-containing protein [bacterium]|nr:amino acid adenylation domain-containing protein [bacterium]
MNKPTPVITKDAIQRIYPLQPMQKGMLFHALREPDDVFYFEQFRYRLQGRLDINVCEQAWNRLLQRHELLRSVFVSHNVPQPVQIVLKQRQVDFHFQDLRAIPAAERVTRLNELLRQERQKGFDLSRDVLIRIRVYQCEDQVYEMVWNFPHILLDGWSGGILQSEFITLYEALRNDTNPQLPPPADYNHYLDWQERNHSQENDRVYWRQCLREYDTLASVPRWRREDRAQQYIAAEYDFFFTQEQTQKFNQLATRLDCTVNAILQTLWGILLARYNQCEDVVFGTVVSGRPPEVEGIDRMIGLFINTLPLRVRMDTSSRVEDVIQNTQAQFMASLEHDSMSLAEIQNLRNSSSELFDHLYVFENFPIDTTQFQRVNQQTLGFEVTAVEIFEQFNYPFGILIQPGNELKITLKYNQAVYCHKRMTRIESHCRTLLNQVLSNPSIPVHELEILSTSEKQNVLHNFQGERAEYPEKKTIIGLWEEQVIKTPHHIALRMQGHSLTYRELDRKANTLAHELQHRYGIEPENRVGVLLHRGWYGLISLLGIMKAGAVYLPIDPSYPRERIDFIIQDAQCNLLIVQEETNTLINQPHDRVCKVDTISWHDQEKPKTPIGSRDLAYMIYTSGSTGQPKGVLLEHRGFINMIQQQINAFAVGEDDRVLQFASCSFDASLSEIFMALLSGACLVLVPNESILDIPRMVELINHEKITVVTFPPSYLRAMDRVEFPHLRVMITAGETLIEQDAQYYASRLRYFNAYGPTEASVCATYHELSPAEIGKRPIPIGPPLANTSIYILDPNLHPAPIGVVGEICIAGPGLARGYWNRPQENKQKFIPNPFAEKEKLYRTGDLGYWCDTGEMVFLGRKDSQVKIHGHRIELGEIEKQIQRVPGIRQALARVVEKEDSEKTLVAYYVSATSVPADDLRDNLKTFLPNYMIPGYFIPLNEIPLTPNQKVDTKRLPNPFDMGPKEQTYTAPRNPQEAKVVEIWERVLSRQSIGIHDSFFALGGHSLLAIQLVGQMGKAGYSISLKTLYEFPTIAQLAEQLNKKANPQQDAIVRGSFPLTPIQHWFFQSREKGYHHFNHYVLLKTNNPIEPKTFQQALNALWLHHDGLRSRFDFQSNQIQQHIENDSFAMPFETIDFREHPQAWPAMEERMQKEQQSINLQNGPLCMQILFHLPDGDYFFWLIHHLITDAVSWNTLLSDLHEAYRLAQQGNAIDLPPKTGSYKQWSQELQTLATRQEILNEKAYWQKVEQSPVPPLPRPLSENPNVYGNTRTHSHTIPLHRAQPSLRQFPIPPLLAALGVALHQWCGNQLFRVLMTSHGRDSQYVKQDVYRTVGWFTTQFPFLLDLRNSADVKRLTLQCEKNYEQIPHKGLGYAILRYLTPAKQAKAIAWKDCPILFNYMGEMFPDRENSALTLCEKYSGASIAPAMERPFVLEFNMVIQKEILHINLSHNKGYDKEDRMDALLRNMMDLLKVE